MGALSREESGPRGVPGPGEESGPRGLSGLRGGAWSLGGLVPGGCLVLVGSGPGGVCGDPPR